MAYDANALYECLEGVYEDEPFDFPREDSRCRHLCDLHLENWIRPSDLDPAARNWDRVAAAVELVCAPAPGGQPARTHCPEIWAVQGANRPRRTTPAHQQAGRVALRALRDLADAVGELLTGGWYPRIRSETVELAELVAVVDVRERLLGNRNREELAQRLPPLGNIEHE